MVVVIFSHQLVLIKYLTSVNWRITMKQIRFKNKKIVLKSCEDCPFRDNEIGDCYIFEPLDILYLCL